LFLNALDSHGRLIFVSDTPELRSSTEIRDYLVDQLNMTLRRPGMFGGEMAIRLVIDHLVHVERREEAWVRQRQAMEDRGAFTVTGVSGAFAHLIPGHYEYGMASVYAEFARAQNWLQVDRTLTATEYFAITTQMSTWVAQDRTLTDVLDAFGPPSVLFGGNNPLSGKTLSYLTKTTADSMISFHLWNGTDPDAEAPWPPIYDEPLLLAVRCGTGRFDHSFAFTPGGQRRRPR
jgi:hypothetical protein